MADDIILRPISLADAEDLARWMRDWRRTCYMEPSGVADRDPASWRAYAITHPDFFMVKEPGGTNLGFVSFYETSVGVDALEIAYYRRPLTSAEQRCLRRGFMADAILQAIREIFRLYPQIQRIYALVVEANTRSARAAEAAGFRRERQAGMFSLYAFQETPSPHTHRTCQVFQAPTQQGSASFSRQPVQTRPRLGRSLCRARQVSYPDVAYVLERGSLGRAL